MSCRNVFANGSLRQIHGSIITPPVNPSIAALGNGGSKAIHFRIGNILVQVPSYGFSESISSSHLYPFVEAHHFVRFSWLRKERSFVSYSFHISLTESYDVLSPSSSIIEDIRGMCATGLASLAFYYCDFGVDEKKGLRGLLSSLLVQLCGQSDPYYDFLSHFYSAHRSGEQQASDNELAQCLEQMLDLPQRPATYVIIDALDECPRTTGLPSPREEVLELVKELVRLHVPNLRICVTSRPEADIEPVLGPLAFRSISLHGECGQAQDIVDYIKFVVNSDPNMGSWRSADKELVTEVLTRKADGM